ncbi:hypothetical protein N6H18_05090 [Reichenbachiella agarivorans]|uniref:Uncharacterized protein n=1 Tax=Reichenbachiella agarivorans TaxID=2979464 RepID=A0ABY6CTK6_9BACT|nr:hypothetical protein [Reichenbachiella agarivorans]UXP33325.1 hypothetical protein N6H18_05090 [Reichenbachiella agarivorans]
MNRPEKEILTLRPIIPQASTYASGAVETFQNATLRPIIKLQHDLIIILVIKEKTFELAVVNSRTQNEYQYQIGIWLQKRPKTKNQLIGLVLGMMTQEEMLIYHQHYTEFNKRIIQMIVQRLTDTLF